MSNFELMAELKLIKLLQQQVTNLDTNSLMLVSNHSITIPVEFQKTWVGELKKHYCDLILVVQKQIKDSKNEKDYKQKS